ncbi:MAG: class I SAM-dependent methyltransferase [Bacteroidetes bacterium]|nr:class I SAM-dependent methyltransferase [Bacteroidota bacterium]
MNFYKSISTYYHHIFPLNIAQVAFVRQSFNETQQLELLDIGCGIGELSFELSRHFKKVDAIDLDESMIKKADQDFGPKARNLNFNVFNMLEIERNFGANSMDTIVCFGNTLVHLDGPKQLLNFFRQSRSVLKKHGKLLLQIINYDRIIDQNIHFLPTIENDVIKFVRNYRLHPNQKKLDFETILTIKETGKTFENTIPLYPLRKLEIDQLLTSAGYAEIKYFGNFKREDLQENSMQLIIEAKK